MAVNLSKGKGGGKRGGKASGGAMSLNITWDDKALEADLQELDTRVKRAIAGTMLQLAPQVEAWMRNNAPWQDQTGNARSGLTARAEVVDGGTIARLVCSHTVPYGIWLEVRWSGRYQIIAPAVQRFGPEAMGMVGRLLDL